MQNFEDDFSNFLETYQADQLFDGFFMAIREAFLSGYRCGGGEPIEVQKVIKIINNPDK